MAESKSQFDAFLAQEIQNSAGIYFPVKTTILTRMVVRKADCYSLHPNPEDEFCDPKIGPNYRIISEYQDRFLNAVKYSQYYYDECEPIVVERTHPDGYRIINGHHRWAAALRIGQTKIPVQIVNLTHEEDVKQILENSKHTKRAAFDLDEVLFQSDQCEYLEKPIPFPWNKIYKERIRLGVPALFHYLAKNGYDIWVYSAQYYSTDYIQKYFQKYHVRVDGIMTAIGKRGKSAGDTNKRIEKMITDKYTSTIHIDNDSVLQISSATRKYQDFALPGDFSEWSKHVMDAVDAIESGGGKEA